MDITRASKIAISVVALFLSASAAANESESSADAPECEGPFKGHKKPTKEQLTALLNRHEQLEEKLTEAVYEGREIRPRDLWDIGHPLRANLCEADLTDPSLWPVIRSKKLARINLSGANLKGAQLQGATLINADLTNAEMVGIDLQEADLGSATLRGANLSVVAIVDYGDGTEEGFKTLETVTASLAGANLYGADLTDARLQSADLSDAMLFDSILENAILGNANMSSVNLYNADLTNASMNGTELHSANFEPKPGSVATIRYVQSLKGLSTLVYETDPASLFALREVYRSTGQRRQEREVTYALEHGKTAKAAFPERVFRYAFFDATCRFGMSPGRPLGLVFLLLFVFAVPYLVALRWEFGRGAVWRVWLPNRIDRKQGSEDPEILRPTRFAWFGLALYFSVLSASHLGWRDLNVGAWISRMQPREYALRATGWVRVLSGAQSLVSIYLLALSVLTYFGRPFG